MPGNFAEFGPEASGTRLADLDRQDEEAQQYKNMQALATTAHLGAQTRLVNSQADQAEAEAKGMAGLAAGGGAPVQGGQPQRISDVFYSQGMQLLQAGAFNAGTKRLKDASLAAEHEAIAGYREAQAQDIQTKQQLAAVDRAGRAAASITDQASWDIARQRAMAGNADPRMAQMAAQLPESYEEAKPYLDQIAAQAMTAYQQLQARQAAIKAKATDDMNAARQRQINARIGEISEHARLLKQRREFEMKNGGERSGTARELKLAQIALVKEKGTLQDLKTQGKLPTNPLPIPLTTGPLGGEKPDDKRLITNQFYKNAKGQVGRWTGAGFELVQPTRPALPVTTEGDDSEEDDNADDE